MRSFLAVLVSSVCLVMVCGGLSAQTPQRGANGRPAVIVMPPMGLSCPVNFWASRRAIGSVMVAKGDARMRPGPGVQLSFVRSGQASSGSVASEVKDARKIVVAEVTVHGMSRARRMMPLSSDVPDATESFTLRGDDGAGLRRSSVWLKTLSGVSWVELTKVEYADGTRWEASETSKCHSTPSGFLLVGGGS